MSNSAAPKSLPADIEAEKAMLGSILISGNYAYQLIDEIGDKLKAEFFYDPINRVIYQAILELWGSQQPIDPIHVVDGLKKLNTKQDVSGIDQDFLLGLISKSSLLSSPSDTVRLLKEKYLLRTLIGVGEEIKTMAFSDNKLPIEILDLAQKKLFEASVGSIDKNFVRIGEVLSSSFERLEMLQQGEEQYRGLATGFTDLDNMLGGLQNSDLIVLACRPSMGKTAFSLELARRIALKETGVAFFSLEMGADQLCERLIATTSKVDFRKIRHGDVSGDDQNRDFEKIGQAIGVLADLPLWFDDSGGLNITEIRSKARRLKQRHNVGLIIIDYIQLMAGSSDRLYQGNRVQEVADISRALKMLAKDLNIPILALSQLSRKVESRDDKRPILSDLRESGSIEQDADIVMFIHREDYYTRDLPPEKQGKAEIIIAKNRNGETGLVELAWIKHLASFDNLYHAKHSSRIEK